METPENRAGRRWLVIVVVGGYLLQVAWRLWLARSVIAPAGHPDEDGYLLAARALAGGPGGYSTENGPFRRVGYPLLLSPIYWYPGDAFAIFHRAQVLGAVVGGLVFPLGALFARRVLGMPVRWALGTGLAVAALPAVTFYSALAMTDSVLAPLFLAWLVLTHGWLAATSRGWVWAVGAGAVAGFLYTVHVRGTMIVAVHVVLAVLLVATRRVRLPVAALSVLAMVAVGSLDPLLKLVLGNSIVLIGNDPAGQMATAVGVDWGIGLVLLRTIGQLWYLGVATLGLGAVGIVAALRGSGDRARRLTVLAALAATVLIAAGSAASLPFGEHRITYFAYPRYLQFVFPVWFAVGLAALRSADLRRRLVLAGTAAGALVAAAAVVWWRTSQATGYPFVAFDAPETTLLSWQWQHFAVVVPTAVALGIFVPVVAAQQRRWAAAATLAVLTGLAGWGMAVTQQRVIVPMTAPQYGPDIPRLVRDLHLGPGDTVAEAWQVSYPALFNHMREVDWQRLAFFDASQPPPADANVVVAPWSPGGRGPSWDGSRLGMRFVAGAPRQGWAVWKR